MHFGCTHLCTSCQPYSDECTVFKHDGCIYIYMYIPERNERFNTHNGWFVGLEVTYGIEMGLRVQMNRRSGKTKFTLTNCIKDMEPPTRIIKIYQDVIQGQARK